MMTMSTMQGAAMNPVDLTSLMNDLTALEQSLVSVSKQIAQQRATLAATPMTSSTSSSSLLGVSGATSATAAAAAARPVILPCEGFRIDGSEVQPGLPSSLPGGSPSRSSSSYSLASVASASFSPSSPGSSGGGFSLSERHILIENAEQDTAWYCRFFLGKPHHNFLGLDDQKLPFILSILANPEDDAGTGITQIRAILWRRTGTEKISIPTKKNDLSRSDVLKAFHHSYSKWAKPRQVHDQALIKDLVAFEEQLSTKKFKFGVIYAKEGQITDDEFFGNEKGSEAFNEFISILGDRVPLKGWQGFRAGLDTQNDNTGTHSIYTEFLGYEVMFHVSTLLPYSTTNNQQLERKRHVGNDIVVVIFQDGTSTPFSPAFMRTHFNHIFVIVRKEVVSGQPRYRVAICSKDSVPAYGPPLPQPATFEDKALFRKFLITKMINAETAAYTAPAFGQKMMRTLESLLEKINVTYAEPSKMEMLARKATISKATLVLAEDSSDYGKAVKEEMQRHKDAVHHAITTRDNERPMVWKPVKVHPNFPGKIVCADSWGNKVIAASAAGVFLTEGATRRMLWDADNVIQLKVIDHAGILLCLLSKGGKGYLYSFQLSDFNEGRSMTGKCEDRRIEKVKDCHMFAISQLAHEDDTSTLKICVACKQNLAVYEYESVGFFGSGGGKYRKLKDFVLPDACCVLSFCDNNNSLCVGFKSEFNLIDITSSNILELFVASNKLDPLAAIPLHRELLLCYNHMGIFRGTDAKKTREYDLNWTSVPIGMAYQFPFVLAFAPGLIEVRTLINGKLIQTLNMSNITFLTSKSDVYVSSSAEDRSDSDLYLLSFGGD